MIHPMKHEHLMLQANVAVPLVDGRYAEQWMSNLIVALGMKELIPPKGAYCHTEGNRGLTCICAIETSHIVLHSWDETSPGNIQLDVYTCAPLSLDVVIAALDEMKPTNIQYKFYDRDNAFTLLEHVL